jgi:amidase
VTEALLPEVKIFEELGATLEQACPDLSGADEVFRIRRAWQLELAYGSLLDEHRALMKPDAVWNIERGRAITGPEIGRAERLHAALHQRLHEFFRYFDVLLAPVSQVVPFEANLIYPKSVAGVEMTDYLEWMGACSLITVTGCPALSVPAAFTPDGLPVGLQIIGPHRQDRTVLEIGRAFELACGAGSRRPPV